MEALSSVREMAELAAKHATAATRQREALKAKRGMPHWYLAHSGGPENRTIAEFKRSEVGFYYPQTWGQERVPKRELTAARRNSVVVRPVEIPLWRRYFFVHIDLRSPDWRECFERASIYGIMANNEGGRLLPAPVSDNVVTAIKALEVDGVIPPNVRMGELLFAAGDEVRIKNGPFVGGTIMEDLEKPIGGLDESTKVKIGLYPILGRACVVEVPLGDIEKL